LSMSKVLFRRRLKRLAALPLLALVAAAAGGAPVSAAPASPQHAVAQPAATPGLTLTITPSSGAVGQPFDALMTVTNTSGHQLDATRFPGFGIKVPLTLTGTITVVAKPGSSCRWATVSSNRVYYCIWPQPAPAGSSATIQLRVTPSTAGSYTLSGYARYGVSDPNALADTTVLVG
jgi:hypothetical protein